VATQALGPRCATRRGTRLSLRPAAKPTSALRDNQHAVRKRARPVCTPTASPPNAGTTGGCLGNERRLSSTLRSSPRCLYIAVPRALPEPLPPPAALAAESAYLPAESPPSAPLLVASRTRLATRRAPSAWTYSTSRRSGWCCAIWACGSRCTPTVPSRSTPSSPILSAPQSPTRAQQRERPRHIHRHLVAGAGVVGAIGAVLVALRDAA